MGMLSTAASQQKIVWNGGSTEQQNLCVKDDGGMYNERSTTTFAAFILYTPASTTIFHRSTGKRIWSR